MTIRFRRFNYHFLKRRGIWKFVFGLLFVLITSGIFITKLVERPVSPAYGVYHHYPGFWIIMLVTAIGALVAIRLVRVPWWVIYVFAVVYVETLVIFSLLWGVPYGFHDSWSHIATIKAGRIDPQANPYPVFHSLVLLVTTITNLRIEEVVMRATMVSTAVGTGFLVALAHYFPGNRIAQQSTVILLLPIITVRFTPRPYTLAVPFILLFYWYVIRQSNEGYTRSWRIFGFSFISLVYIHPLVALISLFIGIFTYILVIFDRKSILRNSRLVDPLVLSSLAGVLVIHLLTNQVSQNVVESILSPAATTGGAGVGTDQSTVVSVFLSPENFFEAVARLLYVLLLGVATIMTLIEEFRDRFYPFISNLAIIVSAFIFILFMGMLFVPRGFGLYRLLRLLPIVAAPAIVLAFRQRRHDRTEVLTIIFAVLIITAGLGVAFQSSLTGGVAASGNDQQVAGVDWLVEYQPENVIGTGMTFWILEADYGPEVSEELSGKPARGTVVTSAYNRGYSWMTPEHSSRTVFVVDTVERQQAKQNAQEGESRPLECLNRFTTNQNRIYMNPDTSIYRLAMPRSQYCVPVSDQ